MKNNDCFSDDEQENEFKKKRGDIGSTADTGTNQEKGGDKQ